jgi:post-segregation antitoxin (ccd killing protein)
MKLLNVRLAPEDARAVARLRAKGVSISHLVRQAIRAEDAQASRAAPEVDEVLATMLARHPTPDGSVAPGVNAADRKQVAQLIRSRLKRA